MERIDALIRKMMMDIARGKEIQKEVDEINNMIEKNVRLAIEGKKDGRKNEYLMR